MDGKVKVNKVLYLLITFFLGSLGIHKFYVGRVKSGVLYIVLAVFGISTVISLIEFFIFLVQAPDKDGNISV